jgi:putative peptidoglycan lipid II flippase
MNLLKSESFRSGVIQSVLLNIFSKGFTFLNTVLITYYFGVSFQTDIYYYMFGMISLVAGFITVINIGVLVPETIRLKVQESEEAAMNYMNKYAFWHTMIGFIIAVIIIFTSQFVFGGISKFDPVMLKQHANMIIMLVLLLPLMILTQHLRDILSIYKYFSISIILTIINSICSISALVVFGRSGDLSYAVGGLLLGYIINVLLQTYILFKKVKWKLVFKSVKIEHNKRQVFLWYLSNFISIPCASIYLYLIPELGDGYLTAYSLALQVSLLPVQFITVQMIAVISMKFNELFAEKDMQGVKMLFNDAADFTLLLMCLLCGLLVINSQEIITLLFKRGNFDDSAVKLTSYFLKFLAIAPPFGVLASYVSVILTASRQIQKAFYYQIIGNLVLAGCTISGYYLMGADGFLLGLIVYNIINNLMMKVLFNKDSMIEYSKMLNKLFLYLVMCGALCWLTIWLSSYGNNFGTFVSIIVKSTFFTALFILLLRLLKMDEIYMKEIKRVFAPKMS